jgi:hypothetical protein
MFLPQARSLQADGSNDFQGGLGYHRPTLFEPSGLSADLLAIRRFSDRLEACDYT